MIKIGAPTATIDSPIEHLIACHRGIEERLDTLVNAADHLTGDRAAALEAIRKSLHFLETNGAFHTADEEDSLFPRLRPKLTPEELTFVESLQLQHTEADDIYKVLKNAAAAVAGEPSADAIHQFADAANRLRAIYQRHIEFEDQVLMALARRRLAPEEIQQISEEMRARRRGGPAARVACVAPSRRAIGGGRGSRGICRLRALFSRSTFRRTRTRGSVPAQKTPGSGSIHFD